MIHLLIHLQKKYAPIILKSEKVKKLHKMTEAQAVKELEAFGFRLKENIVNLPWQHCMVFVKE